MSDPLLRLALVDVTWTNGRLASEARHDRSSDDIARKLSQECNRGNCRGKKCIASVQTAALRALEIGQTSTGACQHLQLISLPSVLAVSTGNLHSMIRLSRPSDNNASFSRQLSLQHGKDSSDSGMDRDD